MDWPRLYVDSVDGQLVWLSVSVRMDWLVWRASWMKRVEKMVMCLFEVVFFPLKVVIFNWKNKWSITMVKPEARAVTPTEIAIWTDSLNEKLFENNFIQSLIGKKLNYARSFFWGDCSRLRDSICLAFQMELRSINLRDTRKKEFQKMWKWKTNRKTL